MNASRRILTLLAAAAALTVLMTAAPAAEAKRCGAGKARSAGKCVKKCPKGTVKRAAKGGPKCVKRKRPAPAATPAPAPSPTGSPAPGGAAAGAFAGTTDQERSLSFTVAGGQVTDFQAGVNTYCNTFGNQRFQIDAIANVPPLPIGPDGSFAWTGDSDSGNAEIRGTVAGATASGTVGMSRGDSNYTPGEGMTFGTCSASDVAWTASAG